ncbi:MAG: FHA domain-containing protein [Acidimicrobiales bacterium]
MNDALLTLLKWCLLGLVYLFFFRVLQATWFGSTTNVAVKRVTSSKSRGKVRAGAGARAGGGKRSGGHGPSVAPISLVILEPPADAGRHFEVMGEMTIGRAAGCQITLDDTYISQLHARVSNAEAGVVIEDLGSTNGTYLNRQQVTTPVLAGPGDQIQVGGIVMELRQ